MIQTFDTDASEHPSRPPSETFCILPWIHLHIAPGGAVLPCCIADWRKPLGNTSTHRIAAIWNAEPYRQLRLSMMKGDRSATCDACYQDETNGGCSMRMHCNEHFQKERAALDAMTPNGAVNDPRWIFLDVRFSNLCNFKCRTCNAQYSSSWEREDRKFSGSPGRRSRRKPLADDPMQQVKVAAARARIINFAGGEPLLMGEHYQILEHLIAQRLTHIQLRYSTNLSVLGYRGKDVRELWQAFSDVTAFVSLDAAGTRAEYLRHGSVWRKQIANALAIRRLSHHVKLRMSAVVSLFNIYHLPDLLDELATQELIDLDTDCESKLYKLKDPEEFSIRVLDATTKNKVAQRWEDWLDQRPLLSPALRRQIREIIAFLGEDHTGLGPLARRRIDEIDARRKESFSDTFPELQHFYRACGTS